MKLVIAPQRFRRGSIKTGARSQKRQSSERAWEGRSDVLKALPPEGVNFVLSVNLCTAVHTR